jgi:hypothetical protein
MTAPTLYTYAEAARILRQPSDWWLRRNIARLPHVKVGRQTLFADSDLEAILRLCRVPVPTEASSGATAALVPSSALPQLLPSRARRRSTA